MLFYKKIPKHSNPAPTHSHRVMCTLCGPSFWPSEVTCAPHILRMMVPPLQAIYFHPPLEMCALQHYMHPCRSLQLAGAGTGAECPSESHRHTKVWVPMCVSLSSGWAQMAWAGPLVATLQGSFWQCHTRLCFTRFSYIPVSQVKKIFKGSFILLLYFFSSWSFLWVKSLQANAWLLVNLAGGHLYPSSTSLFKHLGWLAFGGLGLGIFLSFPSHNWLFHLLGSFKRWNGLVASSNQNFEKGFETRYLIFICLKWDILPKPVMKDIPKGKRDKGISDCCLLQAYRQYRGRFFSEALNKGTRSNSFKFHQGKFQGFI